MRTKLRNALLTGAVALGIAATFAGPANAVTAPQEGIPNTLASALNVDKANHTATLPIFEGVTPKEGLVWFVLTESSNFQDAVNRGVNWSPKLVNALGTDSVQHVRLLGGGDHSNFGRRSIVEFPAGVNFSGVRSVIPGPNLYPLDPASHAGPIGDPGYSPLFTFGDGIVYNGAEIANVTGKHGKLLDINYATRTATLKLTAGFYLGRDVLYLSTESSDNQQAALENATYAPALGDVPTAGNDDPQTSAREPIIPIVNGPLGANNPQRQGLQSAAAGQGDPLNIIREEPECSNPDDPANCSALQYSPIWDVTPLEWTQSAINAGQRVRVTSHEQAHSLFEQGELVNAAPDGPVNHDPEIDGFRAVGFIVNCPPIFVAPGQ